MVFSSYDLIDISLAGAQEKHPGWVINEEQMEVLRGVCEEVDIDFKTDMYDLDTSVEENGSCVFVLRDRPHGDSVKRWIVEEVFDIE